MNAKYPGHGYRLPTEAEWEYAALRRFVLYIWDVSFDQLYIYFIEEGAAYSYQLDDQGNQHVVQIALRNFWISELSSFFTSTPGMFNIVTHTACTLRVMDKANFEHLCIQFPIFEHFFRILMQNAYSALQQRIATFNSIDAEDRYKAFIEQYPSVMQQIPQYLLASYLGITAPSLSRIRKQLANNAK